VSKSVRTKVPDFRDLCRSLQFSPNSGVGIWESAEFDRARKNPVLRSKEFGKLFTGFEPNQEFARKVERFRRAFRFNVVHDLLDDAPPDAQP